MSWVENICTYKYAKATNKHFNIPVQVEIPRKEQPFSKSYKKPNARMFTYIVSYRNAKIYNQIKKKVFGKSIETGDVK